MAYLSSVVGCHNLAMTYFLKKIERAHSYTGREVEDEELKLKACLKTKVVTIWFLDTRFCMKFVPASARLIDCVRVGLKGFQKQPKVHWNPVHIWYTHFERDVKMILFYPVYTGINRC